MADITIPGVENPNTTKIGGGAQPKFRYVYVEGSTDHGKGTVLQWSDTSGKLGYGVELSVAHSTRVAGVLAQSGFDVSVQPWAWIQTGGYCDYVKADGGVLAPNADTLQGGEFLEADANGYASHLTATTIDGTAGYYRAAFAMNLTIDTGAETDGTETTTCILCCHYQ